MPPFTNVAMEGLPLKSTIGWAMAHRPTWQLPATTLALLRRRDPSPKVGPVARTRATRETKAADDPTIPGEVVTGRGKDAWNI
eukprot:s2265_g2.t1